MSAAIAAEAETRLWATLDKVTSVLTDERQHLSSEEVADLSNAAARVTEALHTLRELRRPGVSASGVWFDEFGGVPR